MKTITVLGANGTMGNNVANLFFAKGCKSLHLICRSVDKAEKAAARIQRMNHLSDFPMGIHLHDYSDIGVCVAKSDLVFESVSEEMSTKSQVLSEAAKHLPQHAFLCTGTSGLSVSELSLALPFHVRSRFLGVHLYNPPHVMTLCEVIPTEHNDMVLVRSLLAYLECVLGRTVICVKDSPAFLGNRIGFQFLNKALQYAAIYAEKGGIDYVDAIFGTHTGRVMPPLATVDFVGLDVHQAIVENLYNNTSDGFHHDYLFPAFASQLLTQGHIGRKVKQGLYKQVHSSDGKKETRVFDLNNGEYRPICRYDFPFVRKMKDAINDKNLPKAFKALIDDSSLEAQICTELLLLYVLNSLHIVKFLSDDVFAAEHAMATGYHWCPPLEMASLFDVVYDIKLLMEERLEPELLGALDSKVLLSDVRTSPYQAVKFFHVESES